MVLILLIFIIFVIGFGLGQYMEESKNEGMKKQIKAFIDKMNKE